MAIRKRTTIEFNCPKCFGHSYINLESGNMILSESDILEIRKQVIEEILDKSKKLQLEQIKQMNGSIYKSRSRPAHFIYQHLGQIQLACKELLNCEM